jgi:hypothetical protein
MPDAIINVAETRADLTPAPGLARQILALIDLTSLGDQAWHPLPRFVIKPYQL